MVNITDSAIISQTLDGIITHWNSMATVLYGYSADEALGRPVSLVPTGYPDDVPYLINKINKGESIRHFETIRQRKDGNLS